MNASSEQSFLTPHPSSETLIAFALGKVHDSQMDELAQHLNHCSQCCRWLNQAKLVDPLLTKLQTIALSPSEVARRGRNVAMRLARYAPAIFDADDDIQLVWIHQYRIECEVGRGGMGVVYKAMDTTLNRTVALKVILQGPFTSVANLARFRLEAELAARVRHPNVVAVYEIGEFRGLPFVAFEWVEGGNLAQRLSNDVSPPRQCAEWMEQIARAAHAAHMVGVIHRDLKPSNILLTKQGQPKVADFGLARQFDQEPGLTLSGSLLGTLQYMPPEQARGEFHNVGPTADVYSLGAILYELLTGRPPLASLSTAEMVKELLESDPRPIRETKKECPKDLEIITLKCLEKNASDRYASACLLADDLERFLSGKPILAKQSSALKRLNLWCWRNPAIAMLTALVSVSLLLGAVVSSYFALVATRQAARSQRDAQAARDSESTARKMADLARAAARRSERVAYDAQVLLLQDAWRNAEANRFFRILEGLSEEVNSTDKAGFEWFYWKSKPESGAKVIARSDAMICSARFSSDGALVACGDTAGDVTIVDGHSYEMLIRFHAHDTQVNYCCFCDDNSQLVTGAEDGLAKLWDVESGQVLQTFAGHTATICQVKPTAHGILTASEDGTIRLWDKRDGKELHQFPVGPIGSICLDVNSDESRLVNSQSTGQLQLWNLDTRQLIAAWPAPMQRVADIAFSPDDRSIAFVGTARVCGVLDAETGKPRFPLTSFLYPLYCVDFDRDGRLLYVSGTDSVIHRIDASHGRELEPLMGHRDMVASVMCHPRDNQTILSASADGTVRLWNPEFQPDALVENCGFQLPMQFGFSSKSNHVAVPSNKGAITLLDVTPGQATYNHVVALPLNEASIAVLSPDGSRLIAADSENQVIVAALSDGANPPGKQIAARRCDEPVSCVCIDPSGHWVAIGGNEGTILICDLETLALQRTIKGHLESVRGLRFSPAGEHLYSSSFDGSVRVWERETGKEQSVLFQTAGRLFDFDFKPNSNSLVVACEDATVQIRDAGTGELLHTLRQHGGPVRTVSFSPDGLRLATAGFDRTVRVWDAETWQEVLTLATHAGDVMDVQFSPDGQSLVALSNEGELRVWFGPR